MMGAGDGAGQSWVQFRHPVPTLALKPASITCPWAKPNSSPLPHQASSMAPLRPCSSPCPHHPLQSPSPCPGTYCIVYPIEHPHGDGEPGLELGGHKAGLGQGQAELSPWMAEPQRSPTRHPWVGCSSQTALPPPRPRPGFGARE